VITLPFSRIRSVPEKEQPMAYWWDGQSEEHYWVERPTTTATRPNDLVGAPATQRGARRSGSRPPTRS
jgi:hypothetical protein